MKFKLDETVRRLTRQNFRPLVWKVAARHVLNLLWMEEPNVGLLETEPEWREKIYDGGDLWGLATLAMYDLKLEGHTPESLATFYVGKQRDYGPQNILRFGESGLEVRLWDKIARLNNLEGRSPSNETVQDTLVDVVGYVVIAVMLRNGWFELPVKAT